MMKIEIICDDTITPDCLNEACNFGKDPLGDCCRMETDRVNGETCISFDCDAEFGRYWVTCFLTFPAKHGDYINLSDLSKVIVEVRKVYDR